MKIFKRDKFRYRVIDPIYIKDPKNGKVRPAERGEIIDDDSLPPDIILAEVQTGGIVPLDIPSTGTYRAKRSFSLRLDDKIEKVERGHCVTLTAAVAARLLASGDIQPVDPASCWQPGRLPRPKLPPKDATYGK